VPPRNTISQLSTSYADPIPSYSHLLNHRRWCHLANTLKHMANKLKHTIFHVCNSDRQHAARLFYNNAVWSDPQRYLFLSLSQSALLTRQSHFTTIFQFHDLQLANFKVSVTFCCYLIALLFCGFRRYASARFWRRLKCARMSSVQSPSRPTPSVSLPSVRRPTGH